MIKAAKLIDDKRLLVDCFLLETKLIYETNNIGKARASLTACKANANLIHVPQFLNA